VLIIQSQGSAAMCNVWEAYPFTTQCGHFQAVQQVQEAFGQQQIVRLQDVHLAPLQASNVSAADLKKEMASRMHSLMANTQHAYDKQAEPAGQDCLHPIKVMTVSLNFFLHVQTFCTYYKLQTASKTRQQTSLSLCVYSAPLPRKSCEN